MSGFHLVPLDGGDPVHLPAGEIVLGRGPFLGISDKRISRNHGLLENLSGQLRLKPTHVNPCFVQAVPTDEPRPLQKDRWYRLQHGELLSLLPGRFVYRVEAVGGDQRPPSEDEDEDEVLPGTDTKAPPAAPVEDHGDAEEADGPGRSLSQGDVCRDEAPSEHRKRVLPAWMMAVVSLPKTPPSTARAQSTAKGRKQLPVLPAQATPTAASSHGAELNGGEEEEEEEERPRKKRRELNDEAEKPQIKTEVLSGRSTVSYHPKTSRSGVDDQSDQFIMEAGAEGGGDASPRRSEVSGSKEQKKKVSVPAPSKPARTPCPYRKDCYRKNPIHFQECSHPGDADYKEEEEEEDDTDRPECPYGTDCYRKNPLHRKEYRHTKRAARSSRTAAKNAPDDDEDEDEYDNSFIDDGSEGSGSDSDYVPRASDDSDKEDVRRLQREATAFLKRRK